MHWWSKTQCKLAAETWPYSYQAVNQTFVAAGIVKNFILKSRLVLFANRLHHLLYILVGRQAAVILPKEAQDDELPYQCFSCAVGGWITPQCQRLQKSVRACCKAPLLLVQNVQTFLHPRVHFKSTITADGFLDLQTHWLTFIKCPPVCRAM